MAQDFLTAYRAGRRQFSAIDLRDADLRGVSLPGVNLARADLTRARLAGVDLRGANLRHALLEGANLDHAILAHASLNGCDATDASLREAELTQTEVVGAILDRSDLYRIRVNRCNFDRSSLVEANCEGAWLRDVSLASVQLTGANFEDATLERTRIESAEIGGARFKNAFIGGVSLLDTDLSACPSLVESRLQWRGTIGIDTLLRSVENLKRMTALEQAPVLRFLDDCGIDPGVIAAFMSRAPLVQAFSSCFISYSHVDRMFARRLHAGLKARAIRCWYDELDLMPGDRILDRVGHAIGSSDRMLVCCSRVSLASWSVKNELRRAIECERERGQSVVIPLMLDRSLLEWEDGLATELRTRLAANFAGWQTDPDVFDREFERVIRVLRE